MGLNYILRIRRHYIKKGSYKPDFLPFILVVFILFSSIARCIFPFRRVPDFQTQTICINIYLHQLTGTDAVVYAATTMQQEEDMITLKLFITGFVAFALVLAAGGSVMAQTITTNGDVSQSDSLVWTISSDALDGVLVPGEVQATTTYNDNTHSTGGSTNYYKNFNLNTGNVGLGQNNVDTSKTITFDGTTSPTGNGRMVSDESIGIDTMGLPSSSSTWPAFHSTVLAGSSFDLLRGSATTSAQSRTVSANPNTPVSLNYNINVHGTPTSSGTYLPAIGSVASYMNNHSEYARGNSTQKSSDLVYSHQSSASGVIHTFTDTTNYQSGINNIF